MKKITVALYLFCMFIHNSTAQSQGIPISKTMFGINAWHLDFATTSTVNFANEFIVYLNDIKASGVTHVRIGGIGPLWDQPYNFFPSTRIVANSHVDRLTKLINAIRDAGMEPIIQVGYNPICSTFTPQSGNSSLGALTVTQQAEVAANLVALLNNTVYPNNRITYWSIANEPDMPVPTCTDVVLDGGFGADLATTSPGVSSATFIASYIREFSAAMKAQDPYILIMGPELAKFGSDGGISAGSYYAPSHKVMKDLLSPATNTAYSIMGKVNTPIGLQWMVDIVSFHHYAIKAFNNSTSDIIDEPAVSQHGLKRSLTNSGSAGGGGTYMGLTEMILAGQRNVSNMSIACTELNIDATDASNSIDESSNRAGVINGYDNRSFLGGQWLCEAYAEAMKMNGGTSAAPIPWVAMMNLWSAKEGGCAATSNGKPLGYINGCTTYTNTRRPMYWHYEMMANNFKGTFFPSVSVNQTNVKAFASRSGDRVAVMILNQSGSNYDFEVGLKGTPTSTATLKIGFNMGTVIATTSNYVADGSNTNTKAVIEANSTVLLIYNCVGKASERRDYRKSDVLNSPNATPSVVSLGDPLVGLTFTGVVFTQNQQVTYNFGTAYTINWLGSTCGPVNSYSSGNVVTFTNCANANNGGKETYTYVVTDADGCSKEEIITIQNSLAVPLGTFYATASGGTATCGMNNGTASAQAYNCYFTPLYSWDGGMPVTTNTVGNLSPGVHTVVVDCGPTVAITFYITEVNKPFVFAGNDFYSGNYCSATLAPWPDNTSNGWVYEWYKNNSPTPFFTTNAWPWPATASVAVQYWGVADYKVVVTSPTCSNSATVKVRGYGDCRRKSMALAGYPCPPPSARPAPEEADTLSADRDISVDQYISTGIYVPSGLKLEIHDCELAIAAAAGITVAAGGTLIARQAYLHPCMDDKWAGVFHHGGSGRLSITNSIFDGGPLSLDNCTNAEIVENGIFSNTTGISLYNCEGFIIKSNTFEDVTTAIKTSSTPTGTLNSRIDNNYFVAPDTALHFHGDDHSLLSIHCNHFENYSHFAIYSENSSLQDFGNSSTGPGNIFASTSSETNHQLWHNGNAINYYCDPTYSFTLSNRSGLTATAQTASADAICPEILLNRQDPVAEQLISAPGQVVNLYPNPFYERFTISYPESDDKFEVRIFESGSGKLLYLEKLPLHGTQYTYKPMGLAPGFYICSVFSQNGIKQNFKMVKVE